MDRRNAHSRTGFRFHPTDEEIIKFLERKMGDNTDHSLITQLDIRNYEPSQLPGLSPLSQLSSDSEEWYFFSPIVYRDANRSRIDRRTGGGFWKVTGYDREIRDESGNNLIGRRTSLVFYQGHGSAAFNTNWVIHEFHSQMESYYENPFVLCRLKTKSNDGQDYQVPFDF